MFYKNTRTDVEYGGNSVIQKKERERLMTHHRERIRHMKSALDMKTPEDQPHLTTYGRNYFAKKKQTTEAAFNDLKMIQAIARTMTRPFPYEDKKEQQAPHSLNRDMRKRELFRITMENHKLLDRLENLKPGMSVKKLNEDYAKNQKYVVNSSWTARRAHLYDAQADGRYEEDQGLPVKDSPQTQSAPQLVDARDRLPPINTAAA
jgi:hypothetical protein